MCIHLESVYKKKLKRDKNFHYHIVSEINDFSMNENNQYSNENKCARVSIHFSLTIQFYQEKKLRLLCILVFSSCYSGSSIFLLNIIELKFFISIQQTFLSLYISILVNFMYFFLLACLLDCRCCCCCCQFCFQLLIQKKIYII